MDINGLCGFGKDWMRNEASKLLTSKKLTPDDGRTTDTAPSHKLFWPLASRAKNERIDTLRNLKAAKPRDYWKIINSIDKQYYTKTANLNDLYYFFKEVNAGTDTYSMMKLKPTCQITTRCNRTYC